MLKYYAIVVLFMSVLDLILMVVDKRRAQKGRWRISEKMLLGVAALGGSFGGFLGMKLVRHKTKHLKFSIGLPLLMILHILLAGLIVYYTMIKK